MLERISDPKSLKFGGKGQISVQMQIMLDVSRMRNKIDQTNLGGGFNPFEKIKSNWIISPSRDEHKKMFELPPPSKLLFHIFPSVR